MEVLNPELLLSNRLISFIRRIFKTFLIIQATIFGITQNEDSVRYAITKHSVHLVCPALYSCIAHIRCVGAADMPLKFFLFFQKNVSLISHSLPAADDFPAEMTTLASRFYRLQLHLKQFTRRFGVETCWWAEACLRRVHSDIAGSSISKAVNWCLSPCISEGWVSGLYPPSVQTSPVKRFLTLITVYSKLSGMYCGIWLDH